MEIGTRYYGVVVGKSGPNARYDCPKCNDRKGRFYLNIGSGRRRGRFCCHNCGFRGEASGTDLDKFHVAIDDTVEEEEPEFLQIPTRPDKSGGVLAFVKRRGVVYPEWGIEVAAVSPYQFRIALPALTFNQAEAFWNFRWYPTSPVDKKVLFPSSHFANISRKSEAVLWNPAVVPPCVTPKPDQVIPVIAEGDMGAWSIYSRGTSCSFVGVAVFGTFISTEQARYFSHFHKVFYMPDADVSFSKILQNVRILSLAGVDEVFVYDKSQYTGPKDDANDVLRALGREWFDAQCFKKFTV